MKKSYHIIRKKQLRKGWAAPYSFLVSQYCGAACPASPEPVEGNGTERRA
jgi:hypothetical protein